MNGIPDDFDNLNAKMNELTESASRIARISTENGMDKKVNEIRKKVDLSRALASSVKMEMPFHKENLTEFAQPRIPPTISSVGQALNIELYVNVSFDPNNSILYFGDASVICFYLNIFVNY